MLKYIKQNIFLQMYFGTKFFEYDKKEDVLK